MYDTADFTAYSRLADELIAKATKEQLADVAENRDKLDAQKRRCHLWRGKSVDGKTHDHGQRKGADDLPMQWNLSHVVLWLGHATEPSVSIAYWNRSDPATISSFTTMSAWS